MKEEKDILACICPHCHATLKIAKPQKAGKYKLRCRYCDKLFAVSISPGASHPQTVAGSDSVQAKPVHVEVNRKLLAIGGLIEKKKGFFHRSALHPLKVGLQYIGRKDTLMPSDIMLSDPTVSRRSVSVNVVKASDNDVPQYLLTVLRAKNPVMVDNFPVKEGESVYLSIGSALVLGQTTLILQ